MASVTELGYIGIGIENEPAWVEFATQVVGLQLLDEGLRDRFFLRMDSWHHRIAVHRNQGDDLLYLGWRVAGRPEFEAMQQQLEAAGVEFRLGTEAEARERHVLALIKLKDPAGIATEIFYGPEVSLNRPFHPGRPMHGRFATGTGGLGHCIVNQPDSERAYQFYKLLGMQGGIDYKVTLPGLPEARLTFMHCNSRQHSIAWGNVGGPRKKINHLLLEYEDLNDLGLTHDAVRARKIPVGLDLGIHSNDRLLTFYAANPSGWLWEVGVQVGQLAPTQQEYYREDVFGHQIETPELIFGPSD